LRLIIYLLPLSLQFGAGNLMSGPRGSIPVCYHFSTKFDDNQLTRLLFFFCSNINRHNNNNHNDLPASVSNHNNNHNNDQAWLNS
jgi:hypothetical protein